MANTIKLKRGSGSDPGASDLVVGEVAVRTDTGKLFTKKDDNSIAEISGGIDDGDKGDITVSNSGATFTIDNGVISTAKIADNAVNSDKLASGLLLNAGTNKNILFSGSIGEIGSVTGFQAVNDAQNANTDFGIRATTIRLATGSAERLRVKDAGIDVTGNITVSGTVDGRDVASDGSKLDGIAASATNVTNTNQLTNGAGFITATLTNEQVQDIVGGMVTGNTESGITVTYQDGDGTLDFSVASQTDNNFTNADHSKLDGIESGATADQTASEILTLIKTVDGSGSGLDADTLDGANASVSASNSTIVQRNANGYIFATYLNTTANDVSSGVTKVMVETGNDNYIRHGSAAAIRTFINVADGANNITNNNQLTNGAGFITSADGGNAATLDSIDSSQFCRSDTADTCSGDITFSGGAAAVNIAANSDIRFNNGNWTGDSTKIQHHSNYLYMQGGSNGIIFRASGGSNRWIIDSSGHFVTSGDSNYDIGTNSTRVRNGYFDTLYGDGSNLTGISAGATGGGSDEVFYENSQTVTTNYTITNGKNAMSAGPITINSGVTVTVGSGETLTIV